MSLITNYFKISTSFLAHLVAQFLYIFFAYKNSLGSGYLKDDYKPNNLSIDRHGNGYFDREYLDPDADDETVSS